ncbi:hypothetical protein [Gallaecimonas xiamenensis]|uniref:Uncharacterized protein n=1 Tax=Gallaecimonas xiamenensis 3-C-1 TaxID=745411 RepID=K2JR66_9GAMM|nr:hypothetical protein [Gallaecimonas xiamenensis]EKE77017.1 hypothetical protein B3C1_02390 [Gallaecimonas xiamenensis 3-C-1]
MPWQLELHSEEIDISDPHAADQILSDEELAFLGELYRPQRRPFRWHLLLYWLALLIAALALFCYAFNRYSLAIDHSAARQGQLLYTQLPSPAVVNASQGLPPGSIVAFFDEQWVACTPLEDGWQCQDLPLP